ncbi:hypothetical protein INN71_02835 [Nocardioides sp. ChNu-153]|uniref:hypothetical protein n=1 Tax=Nocardioides sp. ChNu-153 TaxID=2779364 RepID=UPI00264D785F|nr:hypothetical protein [Nocardioides sp. ChNu-153]MDN7120322.1 hypothetical protein [Nocardioides sp. ChNu-153]
MAIRTPAEAIAWGRHWVTSRDDAPTSTDDWYRWCLVFVRSCFGVAARYSMAGQAWDHAQLKHRTSDPDTIPAGVPIFWELPGEADHVALSLGGGWCLSNDILRRGRIDRVRIDTITRAWGGQLQGWTEDLNGVRVWRPEPAKPEPAKPEPVRVWPTLRALFWGEHQLHLDATVGGDESLWPKIGDLREGIWGAPAVQHKALRGELVAGERAAAPGSKRRAGMARARKHLDRILAKAA